MLPHGQRTRYTPQQDNSAHSESVSPYSQRKYSSSSYVCCSESVHSWTIFSLGVAVGIGDGRQLDLRGGGVNSFLANGRKSTATDKLKISFAEGASGATATTHIIIHWTRRCRKGFSERFGVSNAEDTGQSWTSIEKF